MKKTVSAAVALLLVSGLAIGGASLVTAAPEWPGTEKDLTFYTRNAAGSHPHIATTYMLDILTDKFPDATYVLIDDATAGGAVNMEKTYAAGGDGYTFYVAATEVVFGDVLGTFDYSMKEDFIPLCHMPSNGAPNYMCVSKVTHPELTNLDEVVEYCKAHPGEMRMGYPPNAIGEVIARRFVENYGLDVKWVISEGNDQVTNMMGGLIDLYPYNQTRTLGILDDAVPIVACSTLPVRPEELQGVPNYSDLGLDELSVESNSFLICKNDIDPELAEAINETMNAIIDEVNSDDPGEKAKVLKDFMISQDQVMKSYTIDELWGMIDRTYEAIESAFGGN